MKWTSVVATGCLGCLMGLPSMAEDFATRAQAEELVGQVVGALKHRRSMTLEEINRQDRKWVNRDLYPMVYDMHGRVVAHGRNAKLVGHDLMGMKDTDGRRFVRERTELARNNPRFWQYYKFTDPVSKKVLPKETYCEQQKELIVCAGAYVREALPQAASASGGG